MNQAVIGSSYYLGLAFVLTVLAVGGWVIDAVRSRRKLERSFSTAAVIHGRDVLLPLVEDEWANVVGYGHQNPLEFATHVNVLDHTLGGVPLEDLPDPRHMAPSVHHRWAILDPHDDEAFWVCTNYDRPDEEPKPVTRWTPGAFPITTLWGFR